MYSMKSLKPSRLFRFVALVALVRQTSEAQTQTNLPVTTLPEVTVTGHTNQSLTVPSIAQTKTQIDQTAGGVNIINADSYETGRAMNLDDILKGTPGVYIESRNGTDEVKLSIRGSGLDRTYNERGVMMLQDGVPFTLADGDTDFNSIDAQAYQYVEVYRGANALQYGATTLGGAINFISPTGYTASPGDIRLEAGSYDFYRATVSSGMVIGPVDYYINASSYYRGGFQEHSENSDQRLNGNVGYRLSTNAETRLYFSLTSGDLKLAGALTQQQLETDPRQAASAATQFDEQRNGDWARLADKTTVDIDDDQKLEASAYWANRYLYHPLLWSPYYLNGLGILHIDSDTFGGDVRYSSTADLFGQRNQFVAGIDGAFTSETQIDYANLNGLQGTNVANYRYTSANLDLFMENQHYFIKDLALVTGLQAVYAPRDVRDRFAPDLMSGYNQSGNRDYYGINPKLGLRYDIQPKVQVFANVSRSFEPPSQEEEIQDTGPAGNGLYTPLKTQTATTGEIGTRGETQRVSWDVDYYYSHIDHELLSLYDIPTAQAITVNANHTVHQGVEAGLNTALWQSSESVKNGNVVSDQIVLRQIYNWSLFTFDDDPVYGNNQLAAMPEHVYRVELMYENRHGFYAGPNVEWIPEKYPADYANTLYASSSVTLGFKAGYRTKRGVSVFFEARNLANAVYASAVEATSNARLPNANLEVFEPAEGRAFYGGVEWKF
jgi:iron complex outermembrane receptor protein